MTKLESLFSQYAESHQHRTNVRIHRVAVPILLFCVLGLLWPVHAAGVSLAVAAALGFAGFAWHLDRTLAGWLALEMGLFLAAIASLYALAPAGTVLRAVGGLFAAAWTLQFVGHHIEGRKPSFFDDLLFLLIGPLWTLAQLRRVATPAAGRR